MLFKRPVYKGVIKSVRDSIGHHDRQDIRRYAIIRIGERELQDITCSDRLASHLNPGEEIELELSGISIMSVLFAVFGGLLMFAGSTPELEPLEVGGVIIFIASCIYFFVAFINAGHSVLSVTVNNRKYTDSA